MPRPILSTGSLAALLVIAPLAIPSLATALAAAGGAPNAANLSTQQDMRSISLQNRSHTDIVQAHVQTTDGYVWKLGRNGVASNQGTEIIVPARDCIANIAVRMKNGHKLQAVGLHACDNTEIVVGRDRISIPRQAVPGARQHATPR